MDGDGKNALPTRRIFELIIVTGILVRPAFGMLHLWANKALTEQPEGSILHGTAKVITVVI